MVGLTMQFANRPQRWAAPSALRVVPDKTLAGIKTRENFYAKRRSHIEQDLECQNVADGRASVTEAFSLPENMMVARLGAKI